MFSKKNFMEILANFAIYSVLVFFNKILPKKSSNKKKNRRHHFGEF